MIGFSIWWLQNKTISPSFNGNYALELGKKGSCSLPSLKSPEEQQNACKSGLFNRLDS
jgi:hypothetical protein